jgi:predicted enzyme related to lactoylglutathione lyase
VGVDNLDLTTKRVAESGGTIAVPRMPVRGVGWLAYCKDPDGNIFGVMQSDSNAA